eukprot:sb/3462134/
MLKDVIDLGGTQEDYDLLQNVSDTEEMEITDTAEGLDIGEIVRFMKSNGLQAPKKEKKKKVVEKEAEVSEKKEEVQQPKCPFAPSNPPPHEKLLFKTSEPWFSQVESHKSSLVFEGVEKWRKYAQCLWTNEVTLSTTLRDKHQASDQQWMKTVLSGGTVNDKISAHCLLLQESPVHHITSLEALQAMAKKKSKRMSIQAVETLREMWMGVLLPDDRKLLKFSQHDFTQLSSGEGVAQLALGWLVEERLKDLYGEYLEVIKTHMGDVEVPIRTKMCNLAFQLLKEKPEREKEMLGMLVNKIGDPDKKLASKIIYILGQLLNTHPSMKGVVAGEIERVLFRPNIPERAQYYAICFLTQLQLSTEDGAFATHLIQIYFTFFKESVEAKNVDSRMLGALLTGVNRAYPYSAEGITGDNVDTLFKLVYISNFNVAVQALMLLFQVSGRNADITNRYYQALYAKLLDVSICTSSKKTFLLNLVYKSLKRDTNLSRKVALARRLFQISNLEGPALACASLVAVSAANKESEVTKTEKEEETKSAKYDPAARNPLYSNAEKQQLWELLLLHKNYHPSVTQFVTSLLTEGDISYNGDPFTDFSSMKFLDKFVFKNPKKNIKAANKKFYNRNKATAAEQPQVYSKDFRSQSENKINADEQFFYQYFKESASNTKPDQELDFADDIKLGAGTDKKKKKKGEEDEEDDDDGSEFSYGEMEDGSGDEDKLGDKAYEKFLWENLDSDGESLQGDDDGDSEDDGEGDSDVIDDDEMLDGEGEDDGGWEELDVGELSDEEEEFVEAEKMIVEKSKKKGKKTTGKKDKKKKKKAV